MQFWPSETKKKKKKLTKNYTYTEQNYNTFVFAPIFHELNSKF